MTTETKYTKYLTCSETAKLIRKQLNANFPGVKFSVRSKTYSGGASIDIGWNYGPTTNEVDRIVKFFEGSSFDGMNDLKSPQEAWLLPNGEAVLAYRPESYGGSVPGYKSNVPSPEAVRVSFMADFVFTSRQFGTWQEEAALRDKVAHDMFNLQGYAYLGLNTMGLYGEHDTRTAEQHAHRLLNQTSFKPGESYKGVRFVNDDERNVCGEPMAIIKC